jgi:hypothetical protein
MLQKGGGEAEYKLKDWSRNWLQPT